MVATEKQKEMMKQCEEQPFYVVDKEAYSNMYEELKKGKPFVKTYLWICPHKKKKNCDCPYNKNILVNDVIKRNGKNVYTIEFLMEHFNIRQVD